MNCKCPTCGQALPEDFFVFHEDAGLVVARGLFVHLPRREADILSYLLRRRGRFIPKASLFADLYRMDDEPENEAVVESHISKMRKKLRPLGLVIESERFRGYCLNVRAA